MVCVVYVGIHGRGIGCEQLRTRVLDTLVLHLHAFIFASQTGAITEIPTRPRRLDIFDIFSFEIDKFHFTISCTQNHTDEEESKPFPGFAG